MKRNKISIVKILSFLILTIIIISIILSCCTKSNINIISAQISKQNQSEILDYTLSSKITPDNYGDWAEYEVDLNDDGIYTNDWKIFYNDGNNVYLIAADYLDNNKIPEEAGMTKYDKYNTYWNSESEFANKQGSQDITESVANQFMLKKYKTEYGECSDINAKATAVLLDTNIWKDFAAGFEGSFAYGSPTVEMWTASWNQKGYSNLENGISKESHTYQQECKDYESTETFDVNGYGYRVGETEDDLKPTVNICDDVNGYNDVLYFPHTTKTESTENYFLASPTYRSYTRDKPCSNEIHAECVTGDTLILTSLTGDSTEAKNIKENDYIVYYDMSTETNKLGQVQKVYIHENATNFVKYTFEDGSYLNATDYHPIYTKDGWKSLTQRNNYPIPEIGDEVKTSTGFKKLTQIKEYTASEDCYDFLIFDPEHSYYVDNYFANDTLVETSQPYIHNFSDYKMDCLISCSYNGDIGYTRLDLNRGNAAIRPIVVLPTNTPGTLNKNGFWMLKEPATITVHHLEEGTNKKLVDDVKQTVSIGETYTTSQSEDIPEYYNFTRRTDNWQGEITTSTNIEVTYWYTLKKYKITTEVKGSGGTITDQGLDLCEEVEHGKTSIKDIIVTPNDNYHIKSITINGVEQVFTPKSDGTYTLDKFTNVTENKHIIVEFAKTESEDPEDENNPPQTPDVNMSDNNNNDSNNNNNSSNNNNNGNNNPNTTDSSDSNSNTNDKENDKSNIQKYDKDNSIAKNPLPKTGNDKIIIILMAIITTLGVISFIKYRSIKLK